MDGQQEVKVCDTSSLVHTPNALQSLGPSFVVIPMVAFEEIDGLNHHRNDAASVNARKLIRLIDKLQEEQQSDVIRLENGATVILEDSDKWVLNKHYPQDKADNQILNIAMLYKLEGHNVTLVSNDAAFRSKARKLKIKAISLDEDRVNVRVDDVYPGWQEYEVSPERVDKFYKEGNLATRKSFMPREFVIVKDECNAKHTALGKYNYKDKEVVPLRYTKASPWGISARNVQQQFAMELLLDQDVSIVSLIGKAGTGKTLLALAAGGQAVEEGTYDRMVVYKPLIPVGRDVGFLPGELDDKIGPYMGSIYDNLEFMLGKPEPKGNQKNGEKKNDKVDYLIEKGLLELAALTFIRGRSLPNLYIVVDEAQNLTPHEVKTIATRLGEGSKLVLVGDPYQIDHPYLDSQSNGLTYITERLKGQPQFGSVTLKKQERSSVAEMCAELL